MRNLCLALVVLAAAVLSPAALAAAAPPAAHGNSANAKLCQKGGWKALYTSDGARFSGQGACVSYGAKGGVIRTTPPAPPVTGSQALCESAGGVFATTGPAWNPKDLWTCSGLSRATAADLAFNLAVGDACTKDGGGGSGVFQQDASDLFVAYCRTELPS